MKDLEGPLPSMDPPYVCEYVDVVCVLYTGTILLVHTKCHIITVLCCASIFINIHNIIIIFRCTLKSMSAFCADVGKKINAMATSFDVTTDHIY